MAAQSQSQVDLLPLPDLRPNSPLFAISSHSAYKPLGSSSTVSHDTARKAHRRSRSFSAFSSPQPSSSKSLAHPSFQRKYPSQKTLGSPETIREDPFVHLDGGRDPIPLTDAEDTPVIQPWRSQETWQALHSPTTPQNPRRPQIRPYEGSGWRSKGGGGFFASIPITERELPRSRTTSPQKQHNEFAQSSTSQADEPKQGEQLEPQELESAATVTSPTVRTSILSKTSKSSSGSSLRYSPSIPSRNSSLRIPRRRPSGLILDARVRACRHAHGVDPQLDMERVVQ